MTVIVDTGVLYADHDRDATRAVLPPESGTGATGGVSRAVRRHRREPDDRGGLSSHQI